jgi:hypothetical protein
MHIVTVTLAKGRSSDQKKDSTREDHLAFAGTLGVPKERVTFLIF